MNSKYWMWVALIVVVVMNQLSIWYGWHNVWLNILAFGLWGMIIYFLLKK